MSETKFAEGPWIALEVPYFAHEVGINAYRIEQSNDGYCVAAIITDTNYLQERAKNSANLIAAAPDLYAALIGISEMLWSRPDISDKLRPLMGFAEKAMEEKALAALRKARGES